MTVIEYFKSSIVFWMAWVIIPLIMEILPGVFNFFILIKRRFMVRKLKGKESFYPEITLIIPVYNSESSLRACIKSIAESNYDKSKLFIMLVNNQGKDDSFGVFQQCQKEFPELTMNWMNAKQGKSKALNLALFNSYGKYIIHIDSDGVLHKDAIRNMVNQFEKNKKVDCLTGVVLTNPKMIDETSGFFLRLLRKTEFFEYCQAFLAGRNFEAEFNSIYTLSGAFSAFRKSTILKTKLYNTDTVCEDTHVTFQVRSNLKKKVSICTNAFFFVDPIEDLNQLYTQRQRWQRGELEVSHMFSDRGLGRASGFINNFVVRLLMYDHTFAFPRMIWYFALICLTFMNYPMNLIIVSLVLIFGFYTLSAFIYYLNICSFLKDYHDLKKYYQRKWYLIFFLPLFNFLVFWFRFAGIINSINSSLVWKTKNLTEEKQIFVNIVKGDIAFFEKILGKKQKKT